MIPNNQLRDRDEFYVGYLPTPPGYGRFLRLVLPVLLLIAAVAGVGVAASQRNPGSGVWEDGKTLTLTGMATAHPYAMIRTAGNDSNTPVQTVLLVSEGKFGAVHRLAAFEGQVVRVKGTLLHRDGRTMLELGSSGDAVQAATLTVEEQRRLGQAKTSALGSVTLRGEIIDPKCYIGAMKPGGGKTHKACAQLCVGGGIPPMFVTRDARSHETFYLLTAADGSAIHEAVLPYLGDPVELNGSLESNGDLLVLRIDPTAIRRL